MLSKLILLLGMLVAAAIAYFCVQDNKPLLQSHEAAVTTTPEVSQPVAATSPVITQPKEHAAETTPEKSAEQTGNEAVEKAVKTEEEEKPVQQEVEQAPAVQPAVTEQQEKSVAKETAAVTLTAASLNYTSAPSPKLQLHANTADKSDTLMQTLERICPDKSCKKELIFDDKTAGASWEKEILTILEMFHEKGVSDAKIEIDGDEIRITGSFKDLKALEAVRNSLHELELAGFHVIDQTYLTELPAKAPKAPAKKEVKAEKPAPVKQIVVEPKPKPAAAETEKAPQQLADVQHASIESTQSKINTILMENPIYFKKNSNELTLTSKQVLDRIIDIVNRTTEEIEAMRIAGHTDASGSAVYNKRLSEKRAQSVRDYLIEHRIHIPRIETVGYGEEQPITDNPYDKENRRVEITIRRKGE